MVLLSIAPSVSASSQASVPSPEDYGAEELPSLHTVTAHEGHHSACHSNGVEAFPSWRSGKQEKEKSSEGEESHDFQLQILLQHFHK
jgi:hypothetical protein